MTLRNHPLPLEVFAAREDVNLPAGTVFVYREGEEDRTVCDGTWPAPEWTPVRISESGSRSLHFRTDDGARWPLRSSKGLADFWARQSADAPVCIDITGISDHVWAVLVRSALEHRRDVNVLYVEPADYNFGDELDSGWSFYNLSQRQLEVEALPGFSRLSAASLDRLTFVALLGFEGARVAHALERDEVMAGKAVSIVGAPGFRPEYPIHTLLSNQIVLLEEERWQRVRYVRANCPFSLYRELESIATEEPADVLRIALMGTRPHALGAVLYAVLSARKVELIHDYAIAQPRRTIGRSNALIYHLGEFKEDWRLSSAADSGN